MRNGFPIAGGCINGLLGPLGCGTWGLPISAILKMLWSLSLFNEMVSHAKQKVFSILNLSTLRSLYIFNEMVSHANRKVFSLLSQCFRAFFSSMRWFLMQSGQIFFLLCGNCVYKFKCSK
jgi:hypothetical protein